MGFRAGEREEILVSHWVMSNLEAFFQATPTSPIPAVTG